MTEEEDYIEIAEEKLNSAKILLENDSLSDSVSRSYYSMFNAAKALLLTEGSQPKTHSGTSSELGKLFRDRIDEELLREFLKVQQLREDADYTNRSFNTEEVKEIYEKAQKFLEVSKKVIKE